MGAAGSVFAGKTLDEAVRKGLESLRLTRAEASITVVEEGSGGFLGFGARPFKVRVVPRPGGAIREAANREDDDRRSRDRGGRDRGRGRGGERGGRGRERGRGGRSDEGGREERGQPVAAAGRSDRPERAPRPDREARGDRSDRAPRGDREPRADREPRGDREPRADSEPRGDREPRAERGGREARGDRGDRGDRGGRPERGGRGGREERRRSDEPREGEERRVAAAAVSAADRPAERDMDMRNLPPAGESRPAEGEDRSERGGRRRRRGRRGGMGRGAGTGEGAVMTMPPADDGAGSDDAVMPAVNAAAADEAMREPVAAAPHARGRERSRGPAPVAGDAPMLEGDALAAEGKRWTSQLLTAMGFEATLRATTEGDRVTVVATIEDGENLVAGDQDEVRQAMQQILNRMINQGEGSRYHLQLEINDFWEKRETELANLARKLAAEALEKNAEIATDHLNAQERRIIHVTLREDTRVKTYSLGIGHIKRLAVAPADFPGGPVGEN